MARKQTTKPATPIFNWGEFETKASVLLKTDDANRISLRDLCATIPQAATQQERKESLIRAIIASGSYVGVFAAPSTSNNNKGQLALMHTDTKAASLEAARAQQKRWAGAWGIERQQRERDDVTIPPRVVELALEIAKVLKGMDKARTIATKAIAQAMA